MSACTQVGFGLNPIPFTTVSLWALYLSTFISISLFLPCYIYLIIYLTYSKVLHLQSNSSNDNFKINYLPNIKTIKLFNYNKNINNNQILRKIIINIIKNIIHKNNSVNLFIYLIFFLIFQWGSRHGNCNKRINLYTRQSEARTRMASTSTLEYGRCCYSSSGILSRSLQLGNIVIYYFLLKII